MRRRRSSAAGGVLVLALVLAPVAAGHSGGKAEPQIAAALSGRGLTPDLVSA